MTQLQTKSQTTLRQELVKRLSGRKELERGEASALARELGCSREWVRQVMVQLGMVVLPPRPPAACTGCGDTRRPRKTRLCRNCRRDRMFVTLTCANCGKEFERRRDDHEAFLRRPTVRRRHGPVCSKTCRASVSRVCSWCGEPAGWRWPAANGVQAFCGEPKSCSLYALRAIPPVYWRHLTPSLFPLKDHLAEIADLRANIKSRSRRK